MRPSGGDLKALVRRLRPNRDRLGGNGHRTSVVRAAAGTPNSLSVATWMARRMSQEFSS